MRFSNKLTLIVIVLLGIFLRFYRLSEIPAGVYVDEAALGYNAFSLSETGKDEYGHAMPIFLRSFAAFSSPLYVYLSVPVVSVFGLSAFSTRFLSAFAGAVNILVVYLILDKIFKYKNKYTAIVATLVFAISPWSIFFSRAAFEANLGLLILSVAIYLMLPPPKLRNLIVSALLLGISAYAYQPLRLIPLMLISAHYFVFRSKKYTAKRALVSLFLFNAIIIPQILVSSTPAFWSRAEGLFYGDVVSSQADKILLLPQPVSRFLAFGREFSSQFAAYFSPANLFLAGDADVQRSIPEMGVFYWWVGIPYLVGMYVLARKLPDKKAIFAFLMMVVFAVPAALTKDPFSTLRALNLLIPFIIVIALGMDALIERTGVKKFVFILIILVTLSLTNLWRGYFVLFAGERALTWNYGYEQLAERVANSSEHFVIDTSRIKPPHILLAFYMKIPPNEYQEFARTKIVNGYYGDTEFDTYYKLGNFETRAIDWERDVYREQILVGDELAISEEQAVEHFLEKVFEIRDPLNKVVFQGYRTNPAEKCGSINYAGSLCVDSL